MAKKKTSPKVLANLAKGRAKLKALRKAGRKIAKTIKGKKPFYFSGKKHKRKKSIARKVPKAIESIIITKGENTMARKRKTTKRRAKSHLRGEFGLAGKRRKRRKSRLHGEFMGRRKHRARRLHGAGGAVKGIGSQVMQGVGIGAGAIGGSLVAGLVPIANPKIKSMIPIALGIALGTLKFTKKHAILRSAGAGAIAIGIVSLARQFMPTLPLLAGDEMLGENMLGYGAEIPQLEGTDEFQGMGIDEMTGEELMGVGHLTPADM